MKPIKNQLNPKTTNFTMNLGSLSNKTCYHSLKNNKKMKTTQKPSMENSSADYFIATLPYSIPYPIITTAIKK